MKDSVSSRLADIGTGSGCIAVALAHDSKLHRGAFEISAGAREIAQRNISKNNVEDRVTLYESDLSRSTRALEISSYRPNLPYIPSADVDTLSSEVKDHNHDKPLMEGPTDWASFVIWLLQQVNI